MNQNSHAQASRTTSLVSVASENPDNNMTIIDGGLSNEDLADSISLRKSLSIPNKKQTLRRKAALIYGRKRSSDKVRNFKSTLRGLRNDTEYVIKISFVLSGRKL